MFRILAVLILFTLFCSTISGQLTLKIEIKNLMNNSGCVVMDFKDGDEVKTLSEKITDKMCIITVNDLKPGKYSFKYFHDENNNKKLNTNLIGIPKEGYGFSNNAESSFGPPSIDKVVFEIKQDTVVYCIPRYINY